MIGSAITDDRDFFFEDEGVTKVEHVFGVGTYAVAA